MGALVMINKREIKYMRYLPIIIVMLLLSGCTDKNNISQSSVQVEKQAIVTENPSVTATSNSQSNSDEVVNFDSKAIELFVRNKIDKPEGDITLIDVAGITDLRLEYLELDNLEDLKYFTNLKSLDITSSKIKDYSAIRYLSNLETLFCGYNNIVDISFLSGLKQLRQLDLMDCEIKDITPIVDLTSLKKLDISDNYVTDLKSLKNLINLTDFDAQGNDIKDCSAVSGLVNLKNLNLSQNKLKDCSELKDLNHLNTLDISKNKLTTCTFISSLNRLNELNISYNKIYDPSPISALINLQTLDMNGCATNNLTFLKSAKYLESLTANNCRIKDISALSDKKKLHTLILNDNKIKDISCLAKIKNLDYISFDNNKISDITAFNQLKKIKDVDISFVNNNIPEDQYNKFFGFTKYSKHFTFNVSNDSKSFDIEISGLLAYKGYTAKRIIIRKNNKIYQTINLSYSEDFGYPSTHSEDFCYFNDDMNFDGYKDFGIISFEPMVNNTYLCYLWNNKSDKFVECTELGKVSNPKFDKKNKLVTGYCRNSSSEHEEFTYKYIHGKLTLIKQVDLGYTGINDPNNQYDYTYKLIDGKLKLVKKVITCLKP